VAKYSASGAYQWAKRLGGTYSDAGCCVAVDRSDNAVLTGRFTSINADYGNGWTLSCSGSQSIALVKLSGSTGSTLWAKAYGGSGYNQPQGLAVDRNGDAVITGYFMTATDLGGGSLASAGANDIFLAKYSGVDGSYKWGKRLGSTSGDSGVGVATDPTTGNVVVTGGYNGVVDFGGGGLDTFNNGGIYLAGFDPSGNYLWATATGGGGDAGMGVSIDSSGNLALTGKASYAIYFGGSLSLLGNGQMNVFVAAFTLSGNSAPAYRWAKTVGATSSGASVGNAVALDPLGHILVGGSFTAGVDFGGISATAGAPGYSSGFLTQYSR